ncbi:hypothetical protein THF5G08_30460 [Vibrio jasicida]|nr:hypothetical protein THF5G08_30460 [Vibrio jasicida]
MCFINKIADQFLTYISKEHEIQQQMLLQTFLYRFRNNRCLIN